MFDNIGKKIKSLASIITSLGIVASVLGGLVVLVENISIGSLILCVIIIGLGSLVSWVGSFLLYGFGELIDKVSIVEEYCLHGFGEMIDKVSIIEEYCRVQSETEQTSDTHDTVPDDAQ